MELTYHQSRAIDITQKTVSSISVIGEFLVILTFLSGSKFRKPVNRLVFYATWGNMFSNMATMIGQSAIRIGLKSPLCQYQAFLIQWLMPADALWIFAMAFNVWLSFFYQWDSSKLKSLEWKYALFCYGCPFITALVLLFVKTEAKGKVYGNAVIWCWIGIKWDFLRIAVFYGPVWVIIALTFAIYLRVGAVIWRWRRNIGLMGRSSQRGLRRSQQDNTAADNEITRTDEVIITREQTILEDEGLGRQLSSRPTFRPHSFRHRARVVFSKRLSNERAGRGSFQQSSRTNRAAIQYCKVALFFFIALLIVWVPSTVNRIWTLVYPDDIIFGLQFAAALVLPLQGSCNSFIYFATSQYACRCLKRDLVTKWEKWKPKRKDTVIVVHEKPSGTVDFIPPYYGSRVGMGARGRRTTQAVEEDEATTRSSSNADTIAVSELNTDNDSASTSHHTIAESDTEHIKPVRPHSI